MAYAIVSDTCKRFIGIMKSYGTIDELNILLPQIKKDNSKKYAKRVIRCLNKSRIDSVILNENLLENNFFCQELLNNKKYIITGRRIYKVLLYRILSDVAKQMNVNMHSLKVVLMVKEYCVENVDLIKNLAKEVKSLTIVTTNIDKYNMLVNELLEKYGIILKVYDESKNSFKYSHIVVNIDFDSEELNKINVGSESLILCGFAKNYVLRNNFNGIVIKGIDIISGVENMHGVSEMALCEAKIYNYLRKLKENDRVFEREGYRINGFLGENGKIMRKEFEKLGRIILDK